eukprot:TRINITY_DN54611_c0_g1_i1.p1 TRINITY_DN54611_c0_g1~~TRINITY_DN54611_c0_g1_i1.p1  ORF type:complete len:139 (+),score=40.91 TRINITY_DN54611_c0_g1_i1:185-601(+)
MPIMLRTPVLFAVAASSVSAGVVASDDAGRVLSGTVISDAASTQTTQPATAVTAVPDTSQATGKAASEVTEAKAADKATNWLSRLGDWGIASVVIVIAAGPALLFSFYKKMQQEGSMFDCGRKDDSGSGEESDGDGIN